MFTEFQRYQTARHINTGETQYVRKMNVWSYQANIAMSVQRYVFTYTDSWQNWICSIQYFWLIKFIVGVCYKSFHSTFTFISNIYNVSFFIYYSKFNLLFLYQPLFSLSKLHSFIVIIYLLLTFCDLVFPFIDILHFSLLCGTWFSDTSCTWLFLLS